jgi:hypothetical protein
MRRRLRLVPAASLLLQLACNPFAAANVTEMTPGGNVGSGALDCWLTLEFARLPAGSDARDVRVRFHSLALERPAEFGWDYIAANDVIANGAGFGSGYRPDAGTTPDSPPPLDRPIRVRFPLDARRVIESAPDTLWLEVELSWGGRRVAGAKRTIEHVYRREVGSS